MDNLRGLLIIKRKESPECTDKGVVQSDESIYKGVLRWGGHVERIEKLMIYHRYPNLQMISVPSA